jgi:DNA-binding beta-propeller fold protein YncE
METPTMGRLTTPLVTGHAIDPQSVASQNVGSLPINLIASPDGKFVISTDQGYRQSLWCIRTSDGAGVSHLEFPRTARNGTNGLYYGLAFGPDGTLYAAQGANDTVLKISLDADEKLVQTGAIKARKGDFPSGVAVDGKGHLYVANNDNRAVGGRQYQLPGSIAIYAELPAGDRGAERRQQVVRRQPA